MKKKMITGALLLVVLFTVSVSAYALPEPWTAHYPRGGMLTLSPADQVNNTFAFKASGKTDTRVQLHINGAHTNMCGTVVNVQMFVVNEWGNWIAFGAPKTIALSCEPVSQTMNFTIRSMTHFCIVVSAYGAAGDCVIPYNISTM